MNRVTPISNFPRDIRDLRAFIGKYLPAVLAATGPVLALTAIATLDPVVQPRSAGAAITTDVSAAPAHAPAPTAEPQLAARNYAAHVLTQPMSMSPFHHPAVDRPAPPPSKPVAETAPAPPRPRAQAEFKLTAIVGGRETIAVLNGKVRRKGDDLGDGWSVQSIDRDAGLVTLRHAQEGTRELALKAGSAAPPAQSRPQTARPAARP